MNNLLTEEFQPDLKKALQKEFYLQKPEIVARQLLGKILVRKINEHFLSAIISETEAYLGSGDLSSHSAVGLTQRNSPMFEEGGILYVYKIYGIHHCINVVTETKGIGSAVLIRAAIPLTGVELMKSFRNIQEEGKLCSGPGNLAKAFGFSRDDNFKSFISHDLFIMNANLNRQFKIKTTKRIGIKKSAELMLRFLID